MPIEDDLRKFRKKSEDILLENGIIDENYSSEKILDEIIKIQETYSGDLDYDHQIDVNLHFGSINRPTSSSGPLGKIVKSRIIIFDVKKFLIACSVITISVASTIAKPFLAPAYAVVAISQLRNLAKHDLNELQAWIIYVLWENKGGMSDENCLKEINRQRNPPATQYEFSTAINTLLNLHCVNISEGIIFITEEIVLK